MAKIRKPIVTVVGHVDHGKTSLLDWIRNTTTTSREAGAITQAIGASIIPLDIVKKICGDLLGALELTIPGLLFIDTPGHAAFTNLRRRGGNLADIAIVVVDINEGFKPQTIEAIEILKQYKTPFIVAANKIDLISGWQENKVPLLKSISMQTDITRGLMDKKHYELVGKFYEHGLEAERFDRVDDYTKQIAIVPTCARSGEGFPELLMVLTGLTQKYLEVCLQCDVDGAGSGTILEVKEEKGLGTTMDVILYNGHIKVNDQIVIGDVNSPIVTKVRALIEPKPLSDIMDKRTKFCPTKEVFAATGVKIAAPNIKEVVAGMPIKTATPDNLEVIKEEIQKDVEEVLIETDDNGIIIKADTLGSLEALITLMKEKEFSIRRAKIGPISKKDVQEAISNSEDDPLNSIILGFNVNISTEAQSMIAAKNVKVLTNTVIYRLIEDFELWLKEQKSEIEKRELDKLTLPCKMQLMRGYVFRQSNPAIVGTDILMGKLKTGVDVAKEGKVVAKIKNIQLEKESLSSIDQGKQVAVAYDGAVVGRQISEGDTLYSHVTETDFRKLKELKRFLSKGEIEVLKEIAAIMRKNNPVWGI